MLEFLTKTIYESWLVIGEMAPYLLFGFLAAGVLSVAISPKWIEKHMGQKGFMSVIKASLFGVPLPLCSCGVIPVAASLRQHGASKSATTSFLLSTPQTGIDSILVTYGLLGPAFAIYRTGIALLTGIIGGVLMGVFGKEPGENDDVTPARAVEAKVTEEPSEGSILFRILHYGLVSLPRSIGIHMALGILIAGLLGALDPVALLKGSEGQGILPMLGMLLVGIPLYVCATGSVPIAVGLLHLGFTPGAVLVFLITGPATNAATLTTIWKVLGKRGTFLFLFIVATAGLLSGVLLDAVLPAMEWGGSNHSNHDHGAHGTTGWLSTVSGVLLMLVLGAGILHSIMQRFKPKLDTSNAQDAVTLKVEGMTCSHCVSRVEKALKNFEGVEGVSVQLKPGEAIVSGLKLNRLGLKAAIDDLGFQAEVQGGTPS